MFNFSQYLFNNLFKLSYETKSVLLKSGSSIIVKILGYVFTLTISIFLGRTIGAEGIGLLTISKQLVALIILFSLFGVRFILIKEISIHRQKNDLLAIGQTMNSVYLFNGTISLFFTVIIIFSVPWISNSLFNNSQLEFPLLISVLVVPFQLFSRLFGSALLGFNKVWQSALVDNVLSTFLSILMLGALYFNDGKINVNNVAIIYAISRVVTMCAVGLYWRSNFKYKTGNKFIIPKLIKSSSPLFVVSLTSFLMFKIDSFILGSFIDAKAVGIFAVAASISLLCNFLLQISSQAISPRFAVLYNEGKIKDLQVLLKQVTLVLTILGGFFFLIIIFFGSTILGFWGEEFRSGYNILLILTFSQLYNISTGPIGTLLIMSGYENILMKLNIYLTIFSLLLGLISVYFFGLMAFAVATLIIRITTNSIKILLCKKKLNISMF